MYMEIITIPKKEYKELKKAKAKVDALHKSSGNIPLEKTRFSDTAFGILKKSYSKESSTVHVSRLRNSWRA